MRHGQPVGKGGKPRHAETRESSLNNFRRCGYPSIEKDQIGIITLNPPPRVYQFFAAAVAANFSSSATCFCANCASEALGIRRT